MFLSKNGALIIIIGTTHQSWKQRDLHIHTTLPFIGSKGLF